MRRGQLALVGRRFRTYGDLYHLRFLGRHVYVTRHPEHIQEVLLRQADCFQKPEHGITATQLRRLLGLGLLNANGETWRRHRRLVQPGFSPKALEAYASTFVDATEEAIDRWRPGQTLDVSREMMDVTLRIVAKTLFDHEVTHETDSVARAMRVFRSAFGSLDAMLPDFVRTPGKARAMRALAAIDALIYGMIDRKRGDPSGDDLLSRLVRASSGPGERAGLDRVELRDEVLTLFLAGHETTSHALTWTFHLLSRHPEIERRFHDEIDRVLGDRPPCLADVAELRYVEQVLSESMRLYPPAYAIPRVSTAPTTIAGYEIPAGSDVVMWIYHTHHDDRWYPDPERFDPGRFEPGRAASIPPCAYFPFGAGTRACIGKRFAMNEAVLVLASIGRRMRFLQMTREPIPMQAAVTLAPRGGLPMRVVRRESPRRSGIAASA